MTCRAAAKPAVMEPANAHADEDEDQMPTVPSRVHLNHNPIYLVDKRLGKGGFGQVYLGRRFRRSSSKDSKPYEALFLLTRLPSDLVTISPQVCRVDSEDVEL